MNEFKELLMGCGPRREKFLFEKDNKSFHDLTTWTEKRTIVPMWSMISTSTLFPLRKTDNTFHEIHAYDVLEHLGSQGNYAFFFSEFSEYWRIFKPDGRFYPPFRLPSPIGFGETPRTHGISRRPGFFSCRNGPMTSRSAGRA